MTQYTHRQTSTHRYLPSLLLLLIVGWVCDWWKTRRLFKWKGFKTSKLPDITATSSGLRGSFLPHFQVTVFWPHFPFFEGWVMGLWLTLPACLVPPFNGANVELLPHTSTAYIQHVCLLSAWRLGSVPVASPTGDAAHGSVGCGG